MYDEEKADRIVKFIRQLKHTKGKWAGVPFNLKPWQESIVRPLFGTVNEDGTRQYRTAYITFPRKNGKTELSAPLGLYMLTCDGEWGAEVYSAAADREQASLVFNAGLEMVQQNKALRKRLKITESRKVIRYPSRNSFWKVLSAEAFTKHGLNPSCVIFDELHAQPDRRLWDVLTTGFGAREQPLLIVITTAGYDRNSICYEQYSYAKKVRDGEIIDPTFFSVIYEVGEEEDWTDERVWRKANPALGDFLSLAEFRASARRAKELPAEQNTFRRLRLNQWTEQFSRWIDMSTWDLSEGVVNLDELEGRECYGGLDLSSTTDLTAFVLVFPAPEEGEGVVKVVPHFWIPGDNIQSRIDRDKVPYDVWVRDGLITATEGNVVDYASIRKYIIDAGKRWNIKEIAYDRWSALQIVQELTGEGFTMVEMGQGFGSMSAPSKELQARILKKTLHHGGNPVLRWMMGNVQVKTDAAENIKPDKEHSNARIDGIVATIMALDRILRHEEDGPSVYEERDLVVL
jgi:phage terminase large subunit-like protein